MKNFITTIFLSISIAGFSQVKLEGVIKDSLGSPLELANVIAINKATKSLDSYGITNDKGRFRLDLKKNTIYTIQAISSKFLICCHAFKMSLECLV